MANNYAPQANGLTPNGQPSQRRLRVPAVNEALPYSPFGSIVPFNPDLITAPMALPTIEPTAFEDSEDVKAARRDLQRLSAGARSAERASKRCKQTLNDVKRLLDPTSLPEYKFKTSKRARADLPPSKTQPQLSDFADLVYEGTKVAFSYVTPETSPESDDNIVVKHRRPQQMGENIVVSPRRLQQQSLDQQPRKKSIVRHPEMHDVEAMKQAGNHITPGSDALPLARPQLQNSQVNAHQVGPTPPKATHKAFVLPQTLTPTQTAEYKMGSPRPTPPATAFTIPAQFTPAQMAEYEKVAVPDPRELTPSRNQTAYLSNARRAVSQDQKHKADQAVENMNSLILAIFEAEDQMQPDTSDDVPMQEQTFFAVTEDESSTPRLTDDALLRLDAVVTKVYSCDRIRSFKVPELARVQKLCETYLSKAELSLLNIGEDWEEQDILSWLGRLSSAHHGLIAARTMLRIMAGGSQHTELQSEDHLRQVLDAVRTGVDGCIIPIIEMRSTLGDKIRGEKAAPRNPAFDIAVENRKPLHGFIKLTSRCIQLLGDLFYNTDVDETVVSSLEYLCRTLIFAENATSDRDAALGTVSFEELRKSAMDGLARLFEKYTPQRLGIVDGLLSSLDKLPATKQSARQYSLPDARPIQLVSALLMRLVQTSATADVRGGAVDEEDEDDDAEGSSEESEEYDSEEDELSGSNKKSTKRRSAPAKKAPKDLAALYQPLKKSSGSYAEYITRKLLERALSTSKSSDEPFRRLLDIFVDDFLNVMGSTDWPAAELLLRALVIKLIGLAENHKNPAPSRTLALELLGTIGSGILDLRATAVRNGISLDTSDELSARLANVARVMENGNMSTATLTAFEGPYRVIIEYLDARDAPNDPRLQSARGHHLMQWADFVYTDRGGSPDAASNGLSTTALQTKIRYMIEDEHWLGNAEPEFPRPTTDQGKLAGRLIAANSMLCRAFGRMFSVVLKSLSSEQPTVRSRSLKSVNTLLEKDPAVLDREKHVLGHIMNCLGDASPLVRDSALGLLQKCVTFRPALERQVYERILQRTHDTAVGVRKRAMAFLKQVYLHNDDNVVRAAICNSLISRIKDTEESVADVAKATIEEIWFTSFSHIKSDADSRPVDDKLKLSSHADLIIETVHTNENIAAVLKDLIQGLLTTSKQASENRRISKVLVYVIADLVSSSHVAGSHSEVAIFRTLNVFAEAWPKLFTSDQLGHFEPKTSHLENTHDLDIFRPVVNIFRHTLPVVTGIGREQLEKLLSGLMSSVAKVLKPELEVIAPCIATIDELLGGTTRPLSLLRSLLGPVAAEQQAQALPARPPQTIKRMRIIGQLGKSCDFERHLGLLKADSSYSWYRGDSVTGLLIEIICYFTSPKHQMSVRETAIETVCEICQARPALFERADVINAIQEVLKSGTPSLELAMLTSLEVFFRSGVAGGEKEAEIAAGIEGGAQRLGGTYRATGHDKAFAALSQRFTNDFMRIALSSVSDVALAAARNVVHINTGGHSYPKDSAPGIIALETCPNAAIAGLAFHSHKEQFGKLETVWEKLMVKAVQQAFEYQVQVVRSPVGCLGSPPTAKLHYFWDVTKTGKGATRNKFTTNICASMNFDPAKLKLRGSVSPHLLYVRFCVENIAFFDYVTVSEVQNLLSALEKTVAGTGTEVAQAIESDIQKIQVPVTSSSTMDGTDGIVVASTEPALMPPTDDIDPQRLEQLTVSAQILSLIWETRIYLFKLWNMAKQSAKPKPKSKDESKDGSKETSKVPTRATNAPFLTDTFQSRVKKLMQPLDTDEAKKAMCKAFVEMYSTDSDVKVGLDDDDNMDLDDEDDARSVSSTSKSPSVGATPRGKKRKSVDSGVNGGPKKRGKSRKSSIAKKSDDDDEAGWD